MTFDLNLKLVNFVFLFFLIFSTFYVITTTFISESWLFMWRKWVSIQSWPRVMLGEQCLSLVHYCTITVFITIIWRYRIENVTFITKCANKSCYIDLCVSVWQESVDLGEIMFSLCYLPTAGRLTLTVIKCRNLKAMDITGYSGSFISFTAFDHQNTDVRLETGESGGHAS